MKVFLCVYCQSCVYLYFFFCKHHLHDFCWFFLWTDLSVLLIFRIIIPLSIVYNFPSCMFLIHSQRLPCKSSSFLCRESESLHLFTALGALFSRISQRIWFSISETFQINPFARVSHHPRNFIFSSPQLSSFITAMRRSASISPKAFGSKSFPKSTVGDNDIHTPNQSHLPYPSPRVRFSPTMPLGVVMGFAVVSGTRVNIR